MTSKTHMNQLTRALRILTAAGFLTCGLLPAWAQQDGSSSGSTSGSTDSGQAGSAPSGSASSAPDQGNGAPPAATTPAGPDIENPPLSGLDEPSSELAFGGRSYLVPGIQLSESVNSISSGLGSKTSGTDETARGLGSLDLQKIWKT